MYMCVMCVVGRLLPDHLEEEEEEEEELCSPMVSSLVLDLSVSPCSPDPTW